MSTASPIYPIEKDVEMKKIITLPPIPLANLEIGDSFVFESDNMKNDLNTIRQRMSRYEKNHPPVKFAVRSIDKESVRIFRTEDQEEF